MKEDSHPSKPSEFADSSSPTAKSEVERLMQQARHDLGAGRVAAAYQAVEEAEALAQQHSLQFAGNEQHPAELAQQIRREIDAILQASGGQTETPWSEASGNSSVARREQKKQLADDFPWATSPEERTALEPTSHEFSAESSQARVEPAHTAEVEFLPPPPVNPPHWQFSSPHNELRRSADSAASPDAYAMAETTVSTPASIPQIPWATAPHRSQQNLASETDWPAPHLSATSDQPNQARSRSQVQAAANEQLAMIIPHGHERHKPLASPPRAAANTATALPRNKLQLEQPPQAMSAFDIPQPYGDAHRSTLQPQPPDVFDQSPRPELARLTNGGAADVTNFERPVPPPPSEPDMVKAVPQPLDSIDWQDEIDAAEDSGIAGFSMPVVFGISITAAFGIGLAIRRRSTPKVEA